MAPTYKLTYLPIRGLAETIRFILSYGGAEFEDCRVLKSPELRASTPFGKVPVLEFDGKKIHQSVAICRYLAKQFNLSGATPWEDLQIDMAVDTISDLRTQAVDLIRLTLYGGDESLKAQKVETLLKETLPYYLPKFEELVKTNGGYLVNGKLTWADLYWTTGAETLQGLFEDDIMKDYPNLAALQKKVLALPAIKAWVENRPKSIV